MTNHRITITQPNGTTCKKGICFNGVCMAKKEAVQASKAQKEKEETAALVTPSVVNSTATIDETTKSLKTKIVSEIEKAKTLLDSLTLQDEKAQKALDATYDALDACIKLQNTENAEQLMLDSSKVQGQLRVAIMKLEVASKEEDDVVSETFIEEAVSVIKKALSNVKEQKKNAEANMKGVSVAELQRQKEEEYAKKVNELVKEGIPVIQKAAINAADKIAELQEDKLVQLAAEEMIAEKLEKQRVIDAEVHRIAKKAQATRRNNLRMFEKKEAKDIDAQELKSAARKIIDADPEMRMRYFTGLTKVLLESNKERFIARDRKKLPGEEKYAEDFALEHEIIRRNEKALVDSGYFGEKYGRANITLPEDSEEVQPSLSAVFFGETGGVNFASIFLFIFAAVLVVIIIFAIIAKAAGKKKDHKKEDDEDEDSYEQF